MKVPQKVDKRFHYYLVLDVETTMNSLVYDVGFAVADKHGNIYYKASYVVPEVFFDKRMMKKAFYYDKYNLYLQGIGKIWKAVPFFRVREQIHKTMRYFNIDTVVAYNCNFDKEALRKTWFAVYPQAQKDFFPEETKFHCIQHMSAQVLFTQPTYLRTAYKNGWESEKGNVRTKAENAYRYIVNSSDFEEKHTGLEDVEIEVKIMAKCYAQHKKMIKTPYSQCWKIPQEKYRKIKAEFE